VRVRLGEFDRPEAREASADAKPDAASRIGFTVVPITPEEAGRLGLPREAGVVIDQVPQFGPAAGRVAPRASGTVQVLKSINGQPVATTAQFEAAVARLSPGSVVALRVMQPGLGEMVVNYRLR
jgi:S1-C subfamily serine protease